MPNSLQISAENVALALSAADVGVWDWRGNKGMEQINARWFQMIGYEMGELDMTGFNWYAHVHPDDLVVVQKLAPEQASQSPDGLFEIEFRMRHKLGHWVWIQSRGKIVEWDADGKPGRFAGTHIDITQRRLIADELKHAHATALESEARFRSLTELSADWYWEQDTEFRFIDFLGNLQRAQRRVEIAFGKKRWDLPAFNLTEADWEAHRQTLLAHQPFHNFEILRHDAAGKDYWISISGIPIYATDGQFAGYRGVGRDITAQKAAQDTIRRLAYYDSLTKLPNRQLLMERLSDAVSLCRRQKDQSALLFIDLDGFKNLNDTKGHPMGDVLLSQVGGRLKSAVREVDTVARLGGDEFVVILNALSATLPQAANQARAVGQKMLAGLSEPYDLHGLDYRCTSSMGITLFCGNDLDLEQILQRADLAMYQAKADGRNQLRFFDPEMQTAVEQRSALEAALRLGLLRREICLHYQPIVNAERRLIGVEALARWNHPERGLVMPVEFIPLAESSGLILQLGAQMLRQACVQLKDWAQIEATQHLTLAVNVSARQFRAETGADREPSAQRRARRGCQNARAQAPGRWFFTGRLWHRLLIAELLEVIAVRSAKNRQKFCARCADRPERCRHCHFYLDPGPCAEPERRRRRCGDRRPAAVFAKERLPGVSRLSVWQAAAGGDASPVQFACLSSTSMSCANGLAPVP
jgi:diguanylate cyclase (GGDEF)-like protein/PAS domain S-box-containing protein